MPKFSITSNHISSSLENYIIKQNLLTEDSLNDRRIEKKINFDDHDNDEDDSPKLLLTLGVGSFKFQYKGNFYLFNRTTYGEPLTCNSYDKDAVIYEEVNIICENDNAAEDLVELTSAAMKEQKRDGFIQTYVWDAKRCYWDSETNIPERNFASVILDNKLKKNILDDINNFVCKESKEWYLKHGISYKRGMLLYGPPGSGKSSCIRAIATELKRDIHRIDISDPNLTDCSLINAVNTVNSSSIIYFEDIDTIFDNNRNKLEDCSITFSGLLNALDGLGVSKGQLFILTSNHIERLDKALIRCGRVDVKFKFSNCTKEQAKEMFLRFYPNESEIAENFSKNIPSQTCCADLQNHFILHRKKSAKEAETYKPSKDVDDYRHLYS